MPAASVAYILDPRFPGGTSAAVAKEILTISGTTRPQVFGISSRMFSGRQIAPVLQDALQATQTTLVWDPPKIETDTVILHNPAFLKFQSRLNTRIVARQVLVVTHENFIRPGGAPGFDVAGCLDQVDRASLATQKILAPISPNNRKTVVDWLGTHPIPDHWQVTTRDWFNICDFEFTPPTEDPQDRRGRLSRPGFEKFPPLDELQMCFPDTARSNLILGADHLMGQAAAHPHWTLVPFQGMAVSDFFQEVDFMVYFTAPNWRESFGRVLAEATAAGKLVITDPETGAAFGAGVVTARPAQVDELIARFIQDPAAYAQRVHQAQQALLTFAGDRFVELFQNMCGDGSGGAT